MKHDAGTHRGYVSHRRRGEEACPACKQAHVKYEVVRRRRRHGRRRGSPVQAA